MSIDNVLEQVRKVYGKESIMLYDSGEILDTPSFSTGSLSLDIATGIGGFPEGRIVEIFGHESSGKTTLALHGIREAQRANKVCAIIDMEHALDPKYCEDIGIDMNKLIISQPDYGEMAIDIMERLITTKEIGVIVLDSVTALVTKKELDGAITDSHVAPQARLMSQSLRKINPLAQKNKTTLIFINQTRTKIGVMFGDPTTTSGGDALKFYASMRIRVFGKKPKSAKKEDAVEEINVTAKVVKNKMAPPYKEAHFNIIFGYGIDYHAEIFEIGVQKGIIKKSGSWFSIATKNKETRIGQGQEQSVEYLVKNEKATEFIYKRIMKAEQDEKN